MQDRLKQRWSRYSQFSFILPTNPTCSRWLPLDISLKWSKTPETLHGPQLGHGFEHQTERESQMVGWMGHSCCYLHGDVEQRFWAVLLPCSCWS